jgi:hypothetical protein
VQLLLLLLCGDVVAQWWGCGSSVGGCGSSVGGCGSSVLGDVVAQLGDVVAQWLRSSPGFDPGFPHSLLRGGRNHDCVK